MKMYTAIKFDRAIDPLKHYISIGGFEMEFNNDVTVPFDFEESWARVDVDDPTVLHVTMRALDVDCFPEAQTIHTLTGSITNIVEFYIYTGEEDDPEINPVEILHLSLVRNDDTEFDITPEVLTSFNNRRN